MGKIGIKRKGNNKNKKGAGGGGELKIPINVGTLEVVILKVGTVEVEQRGWLNWCL